METSGFWTATDFVMSILAEANEKLQFSFKIYLFMDVPVVLTVLRIIHFPYMV